MNGRWNCWQCLNSIAEMLSIKRLPIFYAGKVVGWLLMREPQQFNIHHFKSVEHRFFWQADSR